MYDSKRDKTGCGNNISGYLLVRITGKGHKEGFWGEGNVYVLLWVLVENLSRGTLIFCTLMCTFYASKQKLSKSL